MENSADYLRNKSFRTRFRAHITENEKEIIMVNQNSGRVESEQVNAESVVWIEFAHAIFYRQISVFFFFDNCDSFMFTNSSHVFFFPSLKCRIYSWNIWVKQRTICWTKYYLDEKIRRWLEWYFTSWNGISVSRKRSLIEESATETLIIPYLTLKLIPSGRCGHYVRPNRPECNAMQPKMCGPPKESLEIMTPDTCRAAQPVSLYIHQCTNARNAEGWRTHTHLYTRTHSQSVAQYL